MADAEDGRLFELSEKYRALQREAREFAVSVRDIAERADEAGDIDPEMRKRLAASGIGSIMVPAEFGGRYERVDSLAVTLAREAFAAESAHLDSLLGMQGIGSYAISAGGGDAVRREWLPAVGRLEAIAALALTEPDVGSDLKALSTTLEQRDGELVLNGRKSFITNAGDADFYCVLAREGESYSLALVPAATDGVSVAKPHQIIAPHVLGDVVLDEVRVPASHRLGAPGEGFTLVLSTLATFRVSVAGAAVGLATAALEEAVRHAAGREQFGVNLARLGSVPGSLATSWTEIEMARSLTYRAAEAAARDPLANLHLSSMAKVGATEIAGRVVDRSVQTMGRFGLVQGSKIERLYREARPMRIYEGSTEVILDSLAKQLVKGLTR
ncbi:acyl-CoA dehydrogenase family protein [Saccharopolyspora sp. TS4A08]|uniref:Acyl-CoA dehydrogenase family protein n=1 Tax=Saccharopolyspora ipomoeae TaxID=3042027 RepID=A0ABT6PIG4_9PSEU|nr:acyl-CoA dehydrogenase family protein [Saccharopolyspora sp. TS4A08]MDI2027744.1 acyl-CoA dehydrogenase family protein [Saccharopolyspora sp. TS4A08]